MYHNGCAHKLQYGASSSSLPLYTNLFPFANRKCTSKLNMHAIEWWVWVNSGKYIIQCGLWVVCASQVLNHCCYQSILFALPLLPTGYYLLLVFCFSLLADSLDSNSKIIGSNSCPNAETAFHWHYSLLPAITQLGIHPLALGRSHCENMALLTVYKIEIVVHICLNIVFARMGNYSSCLPKCVCMGIFPFSTDYCRMKWNCLRSFILHLSQLTQIFAINLVRLVYAFAAPSSAPLYFLPPIHSALATTQCNDSPIHAFYHN